jgi:hypothetical protein
MLGGCDTDQRLELTAKNLNEVAEACLLDVRDRGMKYEQSPNCNVLGTLSMRYVEAGGFRSDTPARHELTATQARVMAWTAQAISASGNPAIRIW